MLIVYEMGMGVSIRTPQKRRAYITFYTKFYVEFKIKFDSLGLKYKECFNKSLTVMFEIAFA